MASPGMSIQRLLESAPIEAIKKMLPNQVHDLLGIAAGKFVDEESIRKIIPKILDSLEILQGENLPLVVGMLTEEKAAELSHAIGIDSSVSRLQLASECAEKKNFIHVLNFFGIDASRRKNKSISLHKEAIDAGYGLFPHQLDLAEKAICALNEDPKCVLLHMPTGGGKTRTAMHIVARHLIERHPCVVIWLAHSRELLEQAASEFEKAWEMLGNRRIGIRRYWGEYDDDLLSFNDGIVIAGLQKTCALQRRDLNLFLKLADLASLTVVDEAHVAVAPTYNDVVTCLWEKKKKNALLGLTATPGRTWADRVEDKKLSDLFYKKKLTLEIAGYSDPVSYLIENGYLARPHFKLLNAKPGLRITPEDLIVLNESYEISENVLEQLGDNSIRNLLIIDAATELATRHRRIILFAPSVRSARTISAILATRDLVAKCVTGDMDRASRERAITEFKNNRPEPMVLCNYGVLTTGFDAPKTSAAIIARPTMSLVLYSQMVGRATRGLRAGGNAEAEIVTVVDPELPGFGLIEEAFRNWEDVWDE